jgi:Dolichyl-phosphate-mannose-protein mannosyltransferase
MFHKITSWVKEYEKLFLVFLTFVFLLIRIPGLSQPLHQDEYKWPIIVNPVNMSDTEIPHPPLSQFIYRTAGYVVGFNIHFRFVPLFFGTINLLLLYYFLRTNFGRKVATIGATIFTLSYFSVLASLMVDTDGQIMPFFFLLALISYFHFRKNVIGTLPRWAWWGILIIACILGFFVKVSFVLSIGAIVADFIWQKRLQVSKKEMFKYLGYGAIGVVGLSLLLVVSQYIFTFFNLAKAIVYWEHFWNTNRNWFQTGIQVAKACLYTSPLLLLLPSLLTKEDLKKIRVFLFYILFGFIFYIILFDFSLGALDRYLQFLIIPLSVISAIVIDRIFEDENNQRNKEYLMFGLVIALCLSFSLFLTHTVPSLHPKSEWITRIASFHWSFLYPFSGGSGPMGFYVSFLFISLSWIVSVFLFAVAFFKPHLRKRILLLLIPISLMYNLTFTEEYLFGKLYGSAPKLLSNVVEYIKNNPDIKMVTVYNDNGGQEIQEIGKYRKRLYTDPAFDINEKIATLNRYKEHYLEINIPRIDPSSVYRRYLDACKIVYSQTDKDIFAKVYDCRGVKDVKK